MKDLLEAVNLYFEGIHECDVFKLKEVFHPESSLFDADNGNIFVASAHKHSFKTRDNS